METAHDASGRVADRCAGQRAAVARLCDEAHQAQASLSSDRLRMHDLRRRLVAAEHRETAAAEAAQPQRRREEKMRARERYMHARGQTASDEELAEVTADWARAVDRINRATRLAQRSMTKAQAEVGVLEKEVRESTVAERGARFTAEAAEAACIDARVRLASCEENAAVVATNAATGNRSAHASVFDPHAATGGHAPRVPDLARSEPLIIEALVRGDRQALELTGARVADHTGLQPAEAILQLQELIDAILWAASRDGFLVFEGDHAFWSNLTVEEARDVVAALARLGFAFEPSEGWHAGRAPTPMDLSMALAYAGLDSRSMRDLPSTDELRDLPRSIDVDARAFLAATAPELAVDQMARILEGRAARLEPLWDEWGQVRPILLSNRRTLAG